MKTNKSSHLGLNIALVSVLIAVGLHLYLTFQYYDLKFGQVATESVCNINETFNCDVVSASSYSSFLGIPMALWGAVTNGLLFLFLLLARFNLAENVDRLKRYSLYVALFVALTSIVMATISFVLVSALCLFCIGAYLLSFLALLGIWIATDKEALSHLPSDAKDIFQDARWVGVMILVVPAAAFLFHNMIQDSRGGKELQRFVTENIYAWTNAPTQRFADDKGLIKGAEAGAKMTIVEFADFRCPHCKHAAPTLDAFAKAHPENVRLIFKPFPLDGTCNPSPNMQGGDGVSCALSKAALCGADLTEDEFAVHDYLFEHQSEWGPLSAIDSQLEKMTQELKIDWTALKACIDEPATTERVAAMAQEGLDAKITGTPTVFVNGKKLPGAQMLPVLREAYKQL